jgi:predicted acylesterase/phospholipase RssA
VCVTSEETGDTVRLTSYRSPRGRERLLRTTKIWEAGRATSAASSFFDPITIGSFGESFVDGATGANNPVYEVWNEAQDMWPSGSLEDKVKCLVSIGTGVPSLTPFKGDLIGIGKSLLAIATETEKTAERFSRDKSRLEDAGRYYRFNVLRGLEDIGLEDSKRKNAIVAATDRYIESQVVFKQMKACADSMSGREC